jgi:hypothetical protein
VIFLSFVGVLEICFLFDFLFLFFLAEGRSVLASLCNRIISFSLFLFKFFFREFFDRFWVEGPCCLADFGF